MPRGNCSRILFWGPPPNQLLSVLGRYWVVACKRSHHLYLYLPYSSSLSGAVVFFSPLVLGKFNLRPAVTSNLRQWRGGGGVSKHHTEANRHVVPPGGTNTAERCAQLVPLPLPSRPEKSRRSEMTTNAKKTSLPVILTQDSGRGRSVGNAVEKRRGAGRRMQNKHVCRR